MVVREKEGETKRGIERERGEEREGREIMEKRSAI